MRPALKVAPAGLRAKHAVVPAPSWAYTVWRYVDDSTFSTSILNTAPKQERAVILIVQEVYYSAGGILIVQEVYYSAGVTLLVQEVYL